MKERTLKEGFHIFMSSANGLGGWEQVGIDLQSQINGAEKVFDVEFLSNSKIDADSGGSGRDLYYGYQCCVLRKKIPQMSKTGK